MYMKIKIKKSLILNLFVLAAHTGALLIALFLPALPSIRLGLAIVIVAGLWRQHRNQWLAVPAELELRADGLCSIQARDARQSFAGHLVAADVHPGFIRLTVKSAGHRSRVLLVMQDAVEAEAYRELRAAIVQGRLPPVQAAA